MKFYFKFLLDIISFSYTFCFIFYKTSFKWIISTSSTILLTAAHILLPQSQPSFGFQSPFLPPCVFGKMHLMKSSTSRPPSYRIGASLLSLGSQNRVGKPLTAIHYNFSCDYIRCLLNCIEILFLWH
jgi:hypothetical protein